MHCMIGGGKTVVRKPEVAFNLDETHPAQISQMPRDSRLWQIENLHHVANTQLACGKETQDSDSRWISKTLEHPVEVIDGRSACRYRYLAAFRNTSPDSHIRHHEYNMPGQIYSVNAGDCWSDEELLEELDLFPLGGRPALCTNRVLPADHHKVHDVLACIAAAFCDWLHLSL